MHPETSTTSSPPDGLPDMTTVPPDDRDRVWFQTYYQGDRVAQLTPRAILVGGILGGLMSISNLYTTLKLGWAFGVAITASVLSYTLWNMFVSAGLAKSKMTILENNCMQSTASAAGYSTGGTLATAAGAMFLMTGDEGRMGWIPLTAWVFLVAMLGVFIAIPMKRQMINQEQLPFPSGIAAAETLRSLYAEGELAVKKARALIDSMLVGIVVGLGRSFQIIPESIGFGGNLSLRHLALVRGPTATSYIEKTDTISLGKFQGMYFEPSILLIAAGMIVGMRVSWSMMLGAILNYLVIPRFVGTLPDWSELPPPVETAAVTVIPDAALADATVDTDKDGLTDAFELAIGSVATNPDSDADGLPDLLEVGFAEKAPEGVPTQVHPVGEAAWVYFPVNTDGDLAWTDLDGDGVPTGGVWTDANDDGVLDRGEWSGPVDGEVRPRYDVADKDDDNDRTATRTELDFAHLEHTGLLHDGETIAQGEAADADQDGQIEPEEIASIALVAKDGQNVAALWPRPATGLYKALGSRDAADRFAPMDADADGTPDHLDTDDDNDGVPSMEQRAKTFVGHYEAVRGDDGEVAFVKIARWSLWFGTALLVASGLTSFAMSWRTILRAFQSVGQKSADDAALAAIEVPNSWMIIGVVPLTIGLVALCWLSFHIAPWLGVLSVVLSFALSLVAARATGETDTTPVGAMGKITQLTYAALAPGHVTANLMTAGITAGAAGSAADLLTDLKSGYLLGANPRQQFLAQFWGVFFGTVAIIPAWYLLVPDKAALEAFNPPATNMWYAVAQALSQGIDVIPTSAQISILVGAFVGVALPTLETLFPKARPYLPSAMGVGLAFVVTFSSSLAFFLGALIAWRWQARDPESADNYIVPIASGAVAGESLSAAGFAILNTLKIVE